MQLNVFTAVAGEQQPSGQAKQDTQAGVPGKEVVVSAIGLFNKGKSFILNKLGKFNLPTAKSIHTRGLSFLLPDIDKNNQYVFLDTAGTNSPVWGITAH